MCMERKISKYTLFLLIALLITVVVRHFFDPLQLPTETYTLWDIKGNTVIEVDMETAYTMLIWKRNDGNYSIFMSGCQ